MKNKVTFNTHQFNYHDYSIGLTSKQMKTIQGFDPSKNNFKTFEILKISEFMDLLLSNSPFAISKKLAYNFEKDFDKHVKNTIYKDLIVSIDFVEEDSDHYIISSRSFFKKDTYDYYFLPDKMSVFQFVRSHFKGYDNLQFESNILTNKHYKKVNYYEYSNKYIEHHLNIPKDVFSPFIIERNEDKEITNIVYAFNQNKITIKQLEDVKKIRLSEKATSVSYFNESEINLISMLFI